MDRIYLTKDEKDVLKYISENGTLDRPAKYSDEYYAIIVCSLKDKGLVNADMSECGTVTCATRSFLGSKYLRENPKLTNPVKWDKIAMVGNAVGLTALAIIGICNLQKR